MCIDVMNALMGCILFYFWIRSFWEVFIVIYLLIRELRNIIFKVIFYVGNFKDYPSHMFCLMLFNLEAFVF